MSLKLAPGAIALQIEQALARLKIRADQIDGQLPGSKVAPAAAGSPGVIDLDDITGVADGDKGDITVSGGGATWAIDTRAVTAAKLFAISSGSILGRASAGSGDVQELTLGAGLSLAGGVLSATGGGGGALIAPPTSGWSWVNQGGASVTVTSSSITLTDPANASTSYRLYVRNAPATPYTITAALYGPSITADFMSFGVGWRQSSDGKLVLARVLSNAPATPLALVKSSSPTADVANYVSPSLRASSFVWIRIADNGTNRITSVSLDGQNWDLLHSVGRTDYLTADQVTFFVSSRNATWPLTARLVSWQES